MAKSSKPKEKKTDLPHGEICNSCAIKRGGRMPPPAMVTCWQTTCPYCGKDKSCCSVTDYNWPDGTKAIWD